MERHWKKRETGKRWANKGKRGVKVDTGNMRTQEKLKTGESREKGEEIMVVKGDRVNMETQSKEGSQRHQGRQDKQGRKVVKETTE